jgi:hypothetical protein
MLRLTVPGAENLTLATTVAANASVDRLPAKEAREASAALAASAPETMIVACTPQT